MQFNPLFFYSTEFQQPLKKDIKDGEEIYNFKYKTDPTNTRNGRAF